MGARHVATIIWKDGAAFGNLNQLRLSLSSSLVLSKRKAANVPPFEKELWVWAWVKDDIIPRSKSSQGYSEIAWNCYASKF